MDFCFPVFFGEFVSQGLRLIVEYFTVLNQPGYLAIARTLHFPFAIYENIDPIVFEK